MFVYTVYGIPGAGRIRPTRKVSAVSRAKAATHVERSPTSDYGDTVVYAAQLADAVDNHKPAGSELSGGFLIEREPDARRAADHLYLENMQSLLDLRYPQAAATNPDYILQYIARLNRRSPYVTN